MRRWTTKRPGDFDAGTDTLGRLFEYEQQLASQLEAAKADAERLVREAREYASQAERACERTIEERTALLAASHEQQLRNELQRIESQAGREASRFANPDPARTEALVALVLEAIGATGSKTGAAR